MISSSRISPCVMKNRTLFWLLIILLEFHVISVYSLIIGNTEDWVSIDCGNDESLLDENLISWDSDDLYTDAGTNQKIRIHQRQAFPVLSTLRSFPSSNTPSCYKLPIYDQSLRYLVRSGFLYGDYDGLNRLPAFDLLLDGMKMAAIEPASATVVLFDELVYTSGKSGVMSLCLAPRKDGGVPFISSIQAVPVGDDLYSAMESDQTFRTVARVNYDGDDEGSLSSDDNYERLWISGKTPPNCKVQFATSDFNSPENDPPPFILERAIGSVNASSPIILTVDFPNSSSPSPHTAYFVLYFTEIFDTFDANNRTLDVFIDARKLSTVTTSRGTCTVVTLYPVDVTASTVNVTIAAANSSAGLPPFINAMEVFTKVVHVDRAGAGAGPSVGFTFLSSVFMLCFCVLANLHRF